MNYSLNISKLYANIVEKILEVYEAAVRKKPRNDELVSHLFMAYVRTEDYKKQQQTILLLGSDEYCDVGSVCTCTYMCVCARMRV